MHSLHGMLNANPCEPVHTCGICAIVCGLQMSQELNNICALSPWATKDVCFLRIAVT